MKKLITLLTFAVSVLLISSPFAKDRLDLGSNAESQDFAKSMNELSKALGAKEAWQLELAPKEMKGDIISYRKSVKYCKATITMDDDWFKLTNTVQEQSVRSSLDVLHKPALFKSKTLDYYPNSSGELSIIVKGKVVATGRYTTTKTNISLTPGTYKEDTVNIKGKYTAQITVLNNDGRIQFQGTTNIPDSESILLSLRRGSYTAQANGKVQNGAFMAETFSKWGQPLSSGAYSLTLNIYNPKSGLMLEGEETLNLPQTRSLVIVFNPTKF